MWARAVLAGAALLAACARAWPVGALCAKREAAGGARYAAFLSAGTGQPALLEGAWGARGKLRGCWVRREPRAIRAFLASCARRPPAAPAPALRRDVAALWRRRAACAEPATHRGTRRMRRGWTVPGTLWCGAGDSAGNSSELGLFRGPDRCCREHDRCGAQIAALQFNFGIRNYRPHTVSHCDCDAAFRRCLRALNDTISDLIGVTFFDLLEVPCFVLRRAEQCVRWHWWGGCERYEVVPVATMVRQSPYGTAAPAAVGSNTCAAEPGAVGAAERCEAAPGSAAGGRSGECRMRDGGGGSRGRALRSDDRCLPSGLGRLCRAYRHLDRCEHRIAPREAKYGLRNGGARTLFHCNCTRRCAEPPLLAESIAVRCFVLEPQPECGAERPSG
uniref:phospholipase A2 n=1 Tax=Coturnix japonica TaxID=93934 RepID=A0A8C2TVC1_COTJA